MIADTRQDQKNKTRRKLIELALTLSAQKGFSALSLREVTQAAGMTPNAFYRHFRDMEDLGLILLDEVGLTLRKLLRDARRSTSIHKDGKVIEASIEIFLAFVNENSNHFRLLLGERQGATQAFRRAIHSELDQFVSEISEDLEKQYQDAGTPLRNASLTAEAIVAVVFTVGAEALDLPKHKQGSLAERLVEEVKMILRGSILKAKPKTKKSGK
jgi:AcrR family transcriptional regulator